MELLRLSDVMADVEADEDADDDADADGNESPDDEACRADDSARFASATTEVRDESSERCIRFRSARISPAV
jgi:hypothetical protein